MKEALWVTKPIIAQSSSVKMSVFSLGFKQKQLNKNQ